MIPYFNIPIYNLQPHQISVLEADDAWRPHVLIQLTLPGLIVDPALFCWSKKNQGQGVGINNGGAKRAMERGIQWAYLLKLFGRCKEDPSLADILSLVGTKRPGPPTPLILGRLVRLPELWSVAIQDSRHYKDDFNRGPLRYVDPRMFEESPMTIQLH